MQLNQSRMLAVFLLVFLLFISLLAQDALAWDNLEGGDHGGADWVISSNTVVGGVHYNISNFTVNGGITARVYGFDETSTYCYQGSAMNHSGCGLGFGKYVCDENWDVDCANITDSSTSTGAKAAPGSIAYLYVNYTSIQSQPYSDLIYIIDSNATRNVTLNEACIGIGAVGAISAQHPAYIQIRLTSSNVSGNNYVSIECLNNTGKTWIAIRNASGGSVIYDEGIWWKKLDGGFFSVVADNISVLGTLTAQGAGWGGGGGGGGGLGSDNGLFGATSTGGSGSGTGGDGYAGSRQGLNIGGDGGWGGIGGGIYGGASGSGVGSTAGSGATTAGATGGNGGNGLNGGYLQIAANNDTSTDESLEWGGGGAGGGGGGGGATPAGCVYANGGAGGGGGAGNAGGGAIKLYASDTLIVSGTIYTTGNITKTGNGGTGANGAYNANAAIGGSGGNTTQTGTSAGNSGGTGWSNATCDAGEGGSGGTGGRGAGGGVLLKSNVVSITGTIDARSGTVTTNGGTVKIFYNDSVLTSIGGTINSGRTYLDFQGPPFFVSPTPDNASITTNTSAGFNVSVINDIRNFTWNFNSTETMLYDDNLVLMYNFDNVTLLGENTSFVVDQSRYGHNGTCFNCSFVLGRYGYGVHLNGINSIINVSNPSTIYLKNNLTIAVWINIEGNGTQNYPRIIAKSPNADKDWSIRLGLTNGAYFNSNLSGANINSPTAAGMTFGTWNFVVATYDNSAVRIYLNGTQAGSGTAASGDIRNYGGDLIIGADPTPSNYFNGSLDEIRVYNRSMTADEVKQLFFSNLRKYNTSSWQFEVNNTEIGLGTQTYSACMTDLTSVYSCTETRSLIRNGASCSYTSGDWVIQCADLCSISSNVNLNKNNVLFSGTGTVTILGSIFNWTSARAESGCSLLVQSGGRLR